MYLPSQFNSKSSSNAAEVMRAHPFASLISVPTWNYLAVHCTVQATLIEDPTEKYQLLKKFIADHEPAYAEQLRGLTDEFTQQMLAGIVGFELRVTDLQCKLKLNQNRPEAHESMRAMYASGNDNERALVDWMERLGMATQGLNADD